jgi:hypothetical protein
MVETMSEQIPNAPIEGMGGDQQEETGIQALERIAHEYHIELIPQTRGRLNFQCGERTFSGEPECVLLNVYSEASLRTMFDWIAQECQRLDAMEAHDDALVARAREGDEEARQAIVGECIERVKSNTHITSEPFLQSAREKAQEHLDESLASQYPWSYGTLYTIVRGWVKQTYRV